MASHLSPPTNQTPYGPEPVAGTSPTQTFTLTNNSTGTITQITSGFQGADPGDFTVLNTSCTGTLLANTSCTSECRVHTASDRSALSFFGRDLHQRGRSKHFDGRGERNRRRLRNHLGQRRYATNHHSARIRRHFSIANCSRRHVQRHGNVTLPVRIGIARGYNLRNFCRHHSHHAASSHAYGNRYGRTRPCRSTLRFKPRAPPR